MKLIIDIPEEVVTAIQNGQDYRYDIHTAIAQGIEVSTDGDLISREALKKVLCEEYEAREHYIGEKMLEAIDNAPTVEAYTEEQVKELVELNKNLSKERSPGEYVGGFFHLCSNCEADMGGKEE